MKKVKTLLALLLVFVLAFSLTGCSSPTEQASATVTETLSALRDADEETIKQYLNADELEGIGMDDAVEMFKSVFGGLEFEILSSEQVDENTVNVKTKIVARDMKVVMENFMGEVLKYAFSMAMADPQPSEEEMTAKMMDIFAECLADPDVEKITTEYVIPVMKNDEGGWYFESTDELIDVLSGGMMTAADELSKSFANFG